MNKMITNEKLNQITQDMLKNRSVFGATLCVENEDKTLSWLGSAGNLTDHNKYFIASVTKLYVTAIMIMLRNEKKLTFDDKLIQYFNQDEIKGLHIIKNIDYTHQITITHLLSNQSGLPDYFYYEKASGDAVNNLKESDVAWTIDKVIARVKTLKPKFKPGQNKKVNYSDTNYQMLGHIIEKVTGLWIGDVFKKYIFDPLELKSTYAFKAYEDDSIAKIYHRKQTIHAPKYMASVTAEGGIVSTSKECMIFLRAFFNGTFFPVETINTLKQNWRLIFFPGQFYFGLGLEKLWTPRLFFPLNPVNEIIGFWGQTGAFAFYHLEKGLYFTGTINQASGFGHSAAYKAITKIIQAS